MNKDKSVGTTVDITVRMSFTSPDSPDISMHALHERVLREAKEKAFRLCNTRIGGVQFQLVKVSDVVRMEVS